MESLHESVCENFSSEPLKIKQKKKKQSKQNSAALNLTLIERNQNSELKYAVRDKINALLDSAERIYNLKPAKVKRTRLIDYK